MRQNGRGCLVFGTAVCTYRRDNNVGIKRVKKFVRMVFYLHAVFWWMCLGAFLGVVMAYGPYGWTRFQTLDGVSESS
jgi:hypothetical protein